MTYTIAIPDIHGMYNLLEKALEKVERSGLEVSKIVFLGDYVDRGPDSARVVEKVFSLVSWGKAVAIKGNHEELMYSSFDMDRQYDPTEATWWLPNGGDTTLDSYHTAYAHAAESCLSNDVLWLKNLPLYHLDKHRIYVHGFADVEEEDPEKFDSEVVLWGRYDKTEDFGWFGKHVVHGHTPRKTPELKVNRTNLDTGAVFGGVLSVGVFEDDTPGGPAEVWEITMGV